MNGTALDGVTKLNVTLANTFQIAKFSLTKAFAQNDAFPAAWWAGTANKTMLVIIELSTDGQTYTEVLRGNVDSHRLDLVDNSVSVAGRDLAALFTDTRTVATYRNQTPSEIAQTLASDHGLQCVVDAAPSTVFAGRIYDQDHDKIANGDFSDATNEWDLLCRLGASIGIIPYMQAGTLYFQSPLASPPIYQVTFTRDEAGVAANVNGITFERHMTAARDVVVTVQSWNSRKKKLFSSTVRSTTKTPSTDSTLKPSKFIFRPANLNQAQCLALAQQKAAEISTHERNISVRAPSIVMLTPQHVVSVAGTGTDYDMTYYPQTITYDLSFEGGGTTNIMAKFSSPAYLYDNDSGEQIGESA
jgi:phage protein D